MVMNYKLLVLTSRGTFDYYILNKRSLYEYKVYGGKIVYHSKYESEEQYENIIELAYPLNSYILIDIYLKKRTYKNLMESIPPEVYL